MKFKYGTARFTYKKGKMDCLVNLHSSKNPKKRYFWLCFSNRKHQENIFGKDNCQSKPQFCMIIPHIITLDTVYFGKKLWGRLNLTRLGKKDYHQYSSGESIDECGCDC